MAPSFSFDDRTLPFVPGQTVGAALVAGGTTAWRTSRRSGRPRGLFCGIGVCYDCLVTIEGRPNQRACLVLAAERMDVRTQQGNGHDG